MPRTSSRSTEQRAGRSGPWRAALLLGVAAVAVSILAVTAGAQLDEEAAPGEVADEGRTLYRQTCAICHGVDGRGAPPGPPIADLGAAASHFQVTTGRMPPPDDPLVRPPPEHTAAQARAIAEHVGTLGDGPDIPEVDPERGDPTVGYDLYHEHCGACHGPTGRGARMLAGQEAPDLGASSALEIAESMLAGPGEMPSFRAVLDERQMDSVVRHVLEERAEVRGGAPLGHLGPFLEGLVAIVLGLGAIVLILRFGVAR